MWMTVTVILVIMVVLMVTAVVAAMAVEVVMVVTVRTLFSHGSQLDRIALVEPSLSTVPRKPHPHHSEQSEGPDARTIAPPAEVCREDRYWHATLGGGRTQGIVRPHCHHHHPHPHSLCIYDHRR